MDFNIQMRRADGSAVYEIIRGAECWLDAMVAAQALADGFGHELACISVIVESAND